MLHRTPPHAVPFIPLPAEQRAFLEPRNVAVLRARQLGGMLCATPALRAFRNGWPKARITLMGLPWARDFAQRLSAVFDDFVAFPGVPGRPEQSPAPEAWNSFLDGVRRRYDVVVQLQGDGSVTNALVAQLEGRHTAGFFPPDRECPDPARYIPYPSSGRERERLLALTRFLDMPPAGEGLSFPLTGADFQDLEALDLRLGPDSYICLHPGGCHAARRWAPERFAEVADELARRGFRIVLTGSETEVALTRRVASLVRGPVVDLAGRTTLGALAALYMRSCAVVANDTGVAHVADALGVPSAVLFHPSEVERWSPLDGQLHRVISPLATATPREVVAVVMELILEIPRMGGLGSDGTRWSDQ